MKALSQSEYGELRNLYESIYTPKVDLTEELLDEIFDELVDEYIEEGYSEEDAIEIVDEAVDLYIDEVLCEVSDSYYDSAVRASKKAAQGIDKAARQKRRAGQVRYAKRKAGEAFKRGKELAGAAKAGASLAKDFAGDELRRAGRKALHAVTSAPDKAKASVDRKKKGIKGFIKRQAQKVVNRMSEELEAIGEDSRRMSNKQHTQRVRSNIKSFGSNYTPPSNYDPDANRGKGEVLTAKQMEKKRRKALRQEELEATGLFSEMEIEAIMEAEMIDENRAAMGRINKEYHRKKEAEAMAARTKSSKDKKDAPINRKNDNPMYDPSVNTRAKNFKFTGEEVEVDEAMSSYDRNRKRAAQRAAARNAARDAGKTGAVPGVGYVTPRRERETYVDSAGITRHKSGAKMPKD